MEFSQLVWLVPIFPLAAFLILLAFGKQTKDLGAIIGTLGSLASFILSLAIFLERLNGVGDYTWNEFEWLRLGDAAIRFGYETTNLNVWMLLSISFISLLVNLYSRAYLDKDDRITVFYGYVSLFSFSMLALVISSNMLQMFIFWELAGVGCFLLTGFLFQKSQGRSAARKAFLITRIGNGALFIAVLLLLLHMPELDLDFSSIHNSFQGLPIVDESLATAIALLILAGAAGYSCLFPLHIWLADAMEGLSPVSAYIHTVGMAAAGVYLVARTYDIFLASGTALTVMLVAGVLTALLAVTLGMIQYDINKLLAYCSITQSGLIVMVMGLGTWQAYAAGIFRMFTQMLVMPLLVLGAGCMILASGTSDIRTRGGVFSSMRVVAVTFSVGILALAGVFPLSGFWSQYGILVNVQSHNMLVYLLVIIIVFLGGLSVSRMLLLLVSAKASSVTTAVKEQSALMIVPLIILAVLSLISGFIYMPELNSWLGNWLTDNRAGSISIHWLTVVLSTLATVLGLGTGWRLYRNGRLPERNRIADAAPWLYKALHRNYYVEEFFQILVIQPTKWLGQLLHAVDQYIIAGIAGMTSSAVSGIGRSGRRVESGRIYTYGLVMLLCLVILLLILIGRRYFHVV